MPDLIITQKEVTRRRQLTLEQNPGNHFSCIACGYNDTLTESMLTPERLINSWQEMETFDGTKIEGLICNNCKTTLLARKCYVCGDSLTIYDRVPDRNDRYSCLKCILSESANEANLNNPPVKTEDVSLVVELSKEWLIKGNKMLPIKFTLAISSNINPFTEIQKAVGFLGQPLYMFGIRNPNDAGEGRRALLGADDTPGVLPEPRFYHWIIAQKFYPAFKQYFQQKELKPLTDRFPDILNVVIERDNVGNGPRIGISPIIRQKFQPLIIDLIKYITNKERESLCVESQDTIPSGQHFLRKMNSSTFSLLPKDEEEMQQDGATETTNYYSYGPTITSTTSEDIFSIDPMGSWTPLRVQNGDR